MLLGHLIPPIVEGTLQEGQGCGSATGVIVIDHSDPALGRESLRSEAPKLSSLLRLFQVAQYLQLASSRSRSFSRFSFTDLSIFPGSGALP